MKKRIQFDIINILLEKQIITADEIAERMNISNKTVRLHIKHIKQFLSSYNIQIISKRGVGYCIKGNENDCLQLQYTLHEMSNEPYQATTDERVYYILYEVLRFNNTLHISQLERKLYISRSSIYSDLNKVESILKKFHIQLINSSSKGISIIGSEYNQRKALFNLVSKIKNEDSSFCHNHSIQKYVNECLSDNVINNKTTLLLKKFEKKNNIRFASQDFEYLKTMFYITFDRIYRNGHISFTNRSPDFMNSISFLRNIKLAQKIFYEYYHLTLSEDEICYLSSLILSLKNTNLALQNSANEQKALQIVDTFVPIIYKEFHLNNPDDFEKGLYYHLLNILIKNNYDYDYSNPMLEQIKKEFNLPYRLAQQIIPIVQNIAKISFPEDEVAYIAMHIASAIEQSLPPLKVLFLYEHRFSELKYSSSLIEAHIKEIEIIDKMKYQEYQNNTQLPEHNILFTTFPFNESLYPTFQIPMIPDKKFIKNLREILRKLFINQ